jgi:iron(III) transport system substrate-binding protein
MAMADMRLAGVLVTGFLAASFVAQAAAPTTVPEIALYSGADRQAVLEAGAKKEGSVQVYTTGTQTQPIMDAFHAKYPYVRVEVYRGDAPEVARRMIEEYKAGKYTADCPDLSTDGLHPLRDLGYIVPYFSPELAKIRPEAVEAKKHWANDFESYVSLGYNTKLISEAEAPKTYDDLLDPKWKGKMGVGASANTFANTTGAMFLDKGEDFVRKLGATQQVRIFDITGRAMANLVISGEIPLSFEIYNSHVANSREQGAPIAWRALGGVFAQVGAVSIAAHAPHPNATMLFIDYNLSQEGQGMRQKLGYATARTDMTNAEKPEKIHYTLERPTYEQDFEKWLALARSAFGKGQPQGK